MNKSCITGNLTELAEILKSFDSLKIEIKPANKDYPKEYPAHDILICGDEGDQIRKVYANMEVIRATKLTMSERDAALCSAQITACNLGKKPYTLSWNIYGWCVGSQMLSNMGGGRFAQTQRGATLVDCFRYAAIVTSKVGSTFTCAISELPEDVRQLVVAEANRRNAA